MDFSKSKTWYTLGFILILMGFAILSNAGDGIRDRVSNNGNSSDSTWTNEDGSSDWGSSWDDSSGGWDLGSSWDSSSDSSGWDSGGWDSGSSDSGSWDSSGSDSGSW